MIPRVNFDGDYKETCFESTDDCYSDNSYSNIGLSLNSQELIRELHQALFEEESHQRKFEDIVHSILDDIQKYKNDYKRLEIAYKNEKERYEESIRQMLDEAEQQMFLSTDKVKKTERLEAEKMIEKLKQHHEAEIASLQFSLNRMIALEKKYHEDKIAEEYRQNEFKKEIQNITDEKKNLTINLREYQTQISVLRSEIAQLKTIASEKEVNRQKTNLLGKETIVLKNEICLLQDTNKRLNDTNDVLLNEITGLKAKLAKNIEEKQNSIAKILEQEPCQNISSTPIEKYPAFNQFTYLARSRINESYESDDEDEELYNGAIVDSGIWQANNESIFENEKSASELNSSASKLNLTVSPIMSPIPRESILCNQNFKTKNNTVNQKKKEQNFQADKFFKLVFAGDSAVGKTSFIMKYCKGEFSNATSATLGVDFYMKSLTVDDDKDVQLQLWDTCGQERFRSIAKSYFRRADGVVLMYDVTCEQSFINVREWIQSINEITDRLIPIIIIGNKTDLRESAAKNDIKVIDYKDGLKFAKDHGALFIETSSKEGTNIDSSLIDLCKAMIANLEDELKLNSLDSINYNTKTNSIKLSVNDFNKKKLFEIKRRCC